MLAKLAGADLIRLIYILIVNNIIKSISNKFFSIYLKKNKNV